MRGIHEALQGKQEVERGPGKVRGGSGFFTTGKD